MAEHFILMAVLLAGMICSVAMRKLTVSAGIAGGILGMLLFLGAGWTGLALMASFFILATIATSWKRNKKERSGIAEKNKGRRNLGQVLANGGAAALLSLLAIIYPKQSALFQLMIAAAFSSATADTISSELGSLYGKKFYNILSFKKDQMGLDGVISFEGLTFGLAGSFLIALVYAIGFGWNINFLWIILAGTIGNLADSLLGATLERKNLLPNDAVNFLNTAIAAAVCLFFNN